MNSKSRESKKTDSNIVSSSSGVRKNYVLQKILVLVSLPLIALSALVLPSETVNAQLAPLQPFEQSAKRRALAEAIRECISNSQYYLKSTSDIVQGNWSTGNRTPHVSPALDTQDGRYDCNEIARETRSAFGYTSWLDLYCDLGGSRETGGNCREASGQYQMRIPSERAGAAFELLQKKDETGLTRDDARLDYVIGYRSLTNNGAGCNAQPRGVYADLSADDRARSDNVRVVVANADGTTSEMAYYIQNMGRSINMFAQGFGRDTTSRTCRQLVDWVGQKAAAYAEAVKPGPSCEEKYEADRGNNSGAGQQSACRDGFNNIDNPGYCESRFPIAGSSHNGPLQQACLYGQTKAGSAAGVPRPVVVDDSAEGVNPGTCDISGVGWIVCPVMTFMAEISDHTFSIISSLLNTRPEIMDTGSSTFSAWSSFRNLANIGLVLVFLIIIFAQISNLGVSNYNVKKVLPRLVVGAILINVSFYVCQIAVDLSNLLGYSVSGFVDNINVMGSNTDGNWRVGGAELTFLKVISGILIAGGAITLALTAISGPVLLAVVLAVLMVVVILIGRQAAIVLLTAISPLAFLAYMLPNTEQLFTKWRKMFVGLLLVFPIVALLYAAGQIAGSVLAEVAGDPNVEGVQEHLFNITALGATVIPLLATPLLLRGALNSIGTIGGKLSGMSQSANKQIASKAMSTSRFGQFKRYRDDEAAKRRRLIQSGAFQGSNKNPLNWSRNVSSKLNRGFNESKLSGRFGSRSAAAGVAEVTKTNAQQVEEAAILLASKAPEIQRMDTAVESLKQAGASGDVIGARAAQKILLESGAPGLKALHDTIYSMQSSKSMAQDVAEGLQSDILKSGIKGKDSVLNTWAYSDVATQIDNIEKTAGTYSGLNPIEIAGQNIENLRDAALSGGIDSNMARRVLHNESAQSMLTSEKTELLTRIANQEPIVDDLGAPLNTNHRERFKTKSEKNKVNQPASATTATSAQSTQTQAAQTPTTNPQAQAPTAPPSQPTTGTGGPATQPSASGGGFSTPAAAQPATQPGVAPEDRIFVVNPAGETAEQSFGEESQNNNPNPDNNSNN